MPIRNILLTVMLLAAVKGLAQEGGDTQAQIDYAYQTEDGNRLAKLIQNLQPGSRIILRIFLYAITWRMPSTASANCRANAMPTQRRRHFRIASMNSNRRSTKMLNRRRAWCCNLPVTPGLPT